MYIYFVQVTDAKQTFRSFARSPKRRWFETMIRNTDPKRDSKHLSHVTTVKWMFFSLCPLEGETSAYYESSQSEIKKNSETIFQLRQENKNLRKKLSEVRIMNTHTHTHTHIYAM